MNKDVLEQVKSEEFRKLVQLSIAYWKPRIDNYQSWKAYKSCAVLNRHQKGDDACIRVSIRKNLYKQTKKLPNELRSFFDNTLLKSISRFNDSAEQPHKLDDKAFRTRFLKRAQQTAELEAASDTAEAWIEYVDKETDAGCFWVCALVCYIVIVIYLVYECVTVIINGQEVEECEEVEVEEEEEVCEEECHEECEE